ncbi:hypothetical protein GDO78_003733 [Eleutherodactylus coqui]|uniref:Uncharacterized protein n=1 Tax=Eleutherodactylus coqui TaxID=57060 RepID=A0A8J6K0Y9_ELECQ|nr:hypothetical protein GDO78_003733 [Eleutherodactylus coqui]
MRVPARSSQNIQVSGVESGLRMFISSWFYSWPIPPCNRCLRSKSVLLKWPYSIVDMKCWVFYTLRDCCPYCQYIQALPLFNTYPTVDELFIHKVTHSALHVTIFQTTDVQAAI